MGAVQSCVPWLWGWWHSCHCAGLTQPRGIPLSPLSPPDPPLPPLHDPGGTGGGWRPGSHSPPQHCWRPHEQHPQHWAGTWCSAGRGEQRVGSAPSSPGSWCLGVCRSPLRQLQKAAAQCCAQGCPPQGGAKLLTDAAACLLFSSCSNFSCFLRSFCFWKPEIKQW